MEPSIVEEPGADQGEPGTKDRARPSVAISDTQTWEKEKKYVVRLNLDPLILSLNM